MLLVSLCIILLHPRTFSPCVIKFKRLSGGKNLIVTHCGQTC